jgi:hypothetical protein
VVGRDLLGDVSSQWRHLKKYARRPGRVGRTC